MNPRRGHESKLHLEAKIAISQRFAGLTWPVFIEQCDTDVLVMHTPSGFLAAIEVESSPRNVLRNIERNLKNGCHAVAVVSLTERYRNQITNKALSAASELNSGNIRLFPYDDEGLKTLVGWITGLAAAHHPNTGGAR